MGTRGRSKLCPKGRRKPAARLRSLTCGVEVPSDPITRKSVSVVRASDEGRAHAVRRAPSGRRIALLVCLALLGLTATYAFVGGSQALAGTPTGPNPDPPPPPIRHPQPPPPPPPPPPPVQTYQPPPPPPPTRQKKATKRRVVAKHRRQPLKRLHPKPAPAPNASLVLQPERPGRSQILGPSLVRVAASGTISPPSALQFFLALMIGVSVLVAALAVAPRRALPRPLLGVAGGQRELLFFVALAVDAAAGFVLLVYVLTAG